MAKIGDVHINTAVSGAPLPVEIVRPKRTAEENASFCVTHIGGFFLVVWIVMLLLGAVTPWHLSYWQTALAFLLIRLLQRPSGYDLWTRRQK